MRLGQDLCRVIVEIDGMNIETGILFNWYQVEDLHLIPNLKRIDDLEKG